MDPKTELGPLSSQSALDTVLNQVNQAIKQGAKLIAGGKQLNRPGAFMEPTILTGIQKGMNVYAEEVFGPVLMIYAVKDIATGIELANDTRFGLGGTVFGPDMNAAIEVARQMDTGMVYINHVTGIGPELPFGGTKKSGYGREQAEEGIYEFVNSKLIRVTSPAAPY